MHGKITIKELSDIIPIGSNVSLIICRRTNNTRNIYIYSVSTTFHYVPSKIRNHIYPRVTPYKCQIAVSMSISELTVNNIITGLDLNI